MQIFNLISNPENLQLSYRDLEELAGVSIGSVSKVLKDLEDQNFILKTKLKRVLKNKTQLLKRWVVAYQDVLRPRLIKKLMRFTNAETARNWQQLSLNQKEGISLWGGDPAAAILTNQLAPGKFSIYTTKSWQSIGQEFGLVPDTNGTTEILQLFWKDINNEKQVAPALLVYADLMGSGYGRNIEMAKIILENIKELVFNLPWKHNITLLQKVKNNNARILYLQTTIKNRYSHTVSLHQIKVDAYSNYLLTSFVA